VVEIVELAGKGYPAAVNLDSGAGTQAIATARHRQRCPEVRSVPGVLLLARMSRPPTQVTLKSIRRAKSGSTTGSRWRAQCRTGRSALPAPGSDLRSCAAVDRRPHLTDKGIQLRHTIQDDPDRRFRKAGLEREIVTGKNVARSIGSPKQKILIAETRHCRSKVSVLLTLSTLT